MHMQAQRLADRLALLSRVLGISQADAAELVAAQSDLLKLLPHRLRVAGMAVGQALGVPLWPDALHAVRML
jgi:hypothetical protein